MESEYRQHTGIRVRGYELDSYGHVNNAVYLQYLEQGRWEYMKDRGLLDQINKDNLLLVIIETTIKYLREALIFDELDVETTCKAEGPFLIFHQRIRKKGTKEIISRAKVKSIFVDKDRSPQDIPSFVNNIFNQ